MILRLGKKTKRFEITFQDGRGISDPEPLGDNTGIDAAKIDGHLEVMVFI